VRRPGFEPGSTAWEAAILTTVLSAHRQTGDKYTIFESLSRTISLGQSEAKTPKYLGSSKIHQTGLCQSFPCANGTPCAKRHQDILLACDGAGIQTSGTGIRRGWPGPHGSRHENILLPAQYTSPASAHRCLVVISLTLPIGFKMLHSSESCPQGFSCPAPKYLGSGQYIPTRFPPSSKSNRASRQTAFRYLAFSVLVTDAPSFKNKDSQTTAAPGVYGRRSGRT
jgi:hypothetical protein